MRMTAITGKIEKGKLKLSASPSLFEDGTEVILLARLDFDIIAGSDSTRFQLQKAKEALEAVAKEPERALEIVKGLEVRK